MGYVLTNKTAQTPLGFGALGVSIAPGESLTVTSEQAALLQDHVVIAGWVAEGKLEVAGTAEEWVPSDAELEAKRLSDEAAAEELRKLEEAEAERKKQEADKPAPEVKAPEVTPPKVPTPAKR